jgi:dCMP deaminase
MSAINHTQFMNIAKEVAKSSNCISLQVGSIIVVDNRIRSMGYNGTPKGFVNCSDLFRERGPEHTKWSMDHEVHAELNAVLYAAAEGLPIKGGTIYTTVEPCKNCMKHMIGAQLKSCVFDQAYYNEQYDDKTIKHELAKGCGFGVYQLINGIAVDWTLAQDQP